MKKKIWAVLLGTFLLAGVSGCGSDNTAATQTATGVEDGKGNEAEEAVSVLVAVENGSKPLSYIDDDGNVVGYEVDVLKAVDELLAEYEFELEIVGGDATQIGLETGKYALIGGGLYKTPEREASYLLPENVSGVSTIRLFVREEDEEIQSLDDLVGKKITPVSANGGIYNLLVAYNEAHPEAQLTITLSDGGFTTAEYLQDIDAGIYDAMVIPDNLGLNDTIRQLDLSVKAVETPVQVNGTFFALSKDREDLAEKVDEALGILRENGTLSELNIKWYGEDKLAYYEE